jgi:hypothetical protein
MLCGLCGRALFRQTQQSSQAFGLPAVMSGAVTKSQPLRHSVNTPRLAGWLGLPKQRNGPLTQRSKPDFPDLTAGGHPQSMPFSSIESAVSLNPKRMTLKNRRRRDAHAAPTHETTPLTDTNSLFFRIARLLPDSFYRTAAVRRLLKAANRDEAEAAIGMAGLLVEILSHGWLASSLIPSHIGQWMAWLPFRVPWGPDLMGPLAMAAYLLTFKLTERFLEGLRWPSRHQNEFAPTSLWMQWAALLPYASLAHVTSPVAIMVLSTFISVLHLSNDGKQFLPRIQSNPRVAKLQSAPVQGLITLALLLVNYYSDFPFGTGFIIAFVMELASLEITALHSYPPESELALLAMREHDKSAQAGRPSSTQAVIRDILLGKKHLPPLGPILVLNPGYHGFAVRELKRAVEKTMTRKREWNRYEIPVIGVDRMVLLTEPLPLEIQNALNPGKVVVLCCSTSLPAGKREQLLSHVFRSFGDYSVLLILEDSIYRKDKGARSTSWRQAGTLTTWVQKDAPVRLLQVPDLTRRKDELADAVPAGARSETHLAMKRDVAGGSFPPYAAPRNCTPRLGARPGTLQPDHTTYVTPRRISRDQSATVENRV